MPVVGRVISGEGFATELMACGVNLSRGGVHQRSVGAAWTWLRPCECHAVSLHRCNVTHWGGNCSVRETLATRRTASPGRDGDFSNHADGAGRESAAPAGAASPAAAGRALPATAAGAAAEAARRAATCRRNSGGATASTRGACSPHSDSRQRASWCKALACGQVVLSPAADVGHGC